ncbi:MAG: HlyD family efflux transporter periplasmic adaptor subunit [Moraxella sp.]|nr:HlyD family efflux transporter periplasmic adaptor subunit [Moraxella sp.]
MNKKTITITLLSLAIIVGGFVYWQNRHTPSGDTLVLNGNVDIRQVSLAFDGTGRLKALNVEEGDVVQAGEVLGALDTESLHLQAREVAAQIAAQGETLARLKSGARPQELAQAASRVKAAQAQATQAKNELARLQAVAADTDGKATSKQELDAAQSAVKVAEAGLSQMRDALNLLQAGSRKEDVAAANAQLQAVQARQDLLAHQISQGELIAPVGGVVRARLLEVGDMASPQKPVFTLALTEPKWVRVYVGEADLGRVQSGMAASVTTDSDPNQPISGTVGYISSVAEFTPKSVQTQELRSSLVYEVRVRVADPDNRLRLGQPATVRLDLNSRTPHEKAVTP